MGKVELPCPSCGAPVTFQSSVSVLAVCHYCTSTLVRHDLNLEDVGKMATLKTDGSPLQLRVEGRYREDHFTVIGRIQLRYSEGLWNEWHLLFDDPRSGWLGESGGTYAVSFEARVKEPLPRREDLAAGNSVFLKGQNFEITNIDQAVCVGGEGELPSSITPGYETTVVDLSGEGNRFATLDYSEDPPLVFLGEYVEFDELHFSGLRELNGW